MKNAAKCHIDPTRDIVAPSPGRKFARQLFALPWDVRTEILVDMGLLKMEELGEFLKDAPISIGDDDELVGKTLRRAVMEKGLREEFTERVSAAWKMQEGAKHEGQA